MGTKSGKATAALPRDLVYSRGHDAGDTVRERRLQLQYAQPADHAPEHLFQRAVRAFGFRTDGRQKQVGQRRGVYFEIYRENGGEDRLFQRLAAVFCFGRHGRGRRMPVRAGR